jgi:hypothetical protein
MARLASADSLRNSAPRAGPHVALGRRMKARSYLFGLLAVGIWACGGSVEDGKTQGPTGPAPSGTAPTGTIPPGGGGVTSGDDPGNDLPQRGGTTGTAGTCPASMPRDGSPCAPEGLTCLFGKNPSGCDSDSASCHEGTWSTFSTPGCPIPLDAGSD